MSRRRAQPRSSGLRKQPSKRDALLERVRHFALDERRDEPQNFLSLRDAARRFSAPLPRMAAVYRQLAKERILSTIRGSRTLLLPPGRTRTLKVHGLIGIPVSVRRFATLPDYRRCFLRIRDELHARGFATYGMFLEQNELDDLAVTEKLKAIEADAAVWLVPDGADYETPLRLRDRGIRFIGINLAESSGIPCQYHVRRRDALRAMLRAWRARGELNGVVIARSQDEEPTDAERSERLKALIEREQLEVEMVRVPSGKPREVVQKLCAEASFGMLLPGPAAALLAHSAPENVGVVLGSCRTALIDGPIDVPVTRETATLKVNVVSVDSERIATEVAEDILAGSVPDETEPKIFTAKSRLRVPLRSGTN